MLDKVPAPELVVATVANGVQPYAEEHDLPFDELLLQYIRVRKTPPPTRRSACQDLFPRSLISISDLYLGSAGALQLSDHDTLHRMGGQSGCCS